jgi:hypothetical protein
MQTANGRELIRLRKAYGATGSEGNSADGTLWVGATKVDFKST